MSETERLLGWSRPLLRWDHTDTPKKTASEVSGAIYIHLHKTVRRSRKGTSARLLREAMVALDDAVEEIERLRLEINQQQRQERRRPVR